MFGLYLACRLAPVVSVFIVIFTIFCYFSKHYFLSLFNLYFSCLYLFTCSVFSTKERNWLNHYKLYRICIPLKRKDKMIEKIKSGDRLSCLCWMRELVKMLAKLYIFGGCFAYNSLSWPLTSSESLSSKRRKLLTWRISYSSSSCFEKFRGSVVRKVQVPSADHLTLKQKDKGCIIFAKMYKIYIKVNGSL